VSGKSTNGRSELQSALDFVRDGDVFVVTKLDRLARSVGDLASIVQKLETKKVDLVVLGGIPGTPYLIPPTLEKDRGQS
jgi:DNA invertase Pin-like site-specific DNA recombinase